ncbi:MAG: PAS domain-containing protein [Rhodopirellula sp.]|nr:PAS domain-containing protein [Rhodopirellula sp.]
MSKKRLLWQLYPSYLAVTLVSLAAYHVLRYLELSQLVVAVLVASLAGGVSWFVARRISRPLEEIKRGAELFASGDLTHQLPLPASQEIAALAETMNVMAAELNRRFHALVEQRNEREAILSSMVEGVFAVDLRERLISLNHAGAQLLHARFEDVQGRSLQEVVRNPALQRLVAGVLSTQQSASQEIEIHLCGGEQRILDAQGTVLFDSKDQAIGALVVLHDMTRVRRLENVRRDFVANVSHELKTPVTSIKGFVETLLDGALKDPDDAERFLKIVAAQADRLTAIIEDLLTLSRIEQGAEKTEISLAQGRIQSVLKEAAEVCQLKAAEKEIRLEVSCDPELAAEINAALLEQAVVNLIDNAVKYSPNRGSVLVDAIRTPAEVVIRVRDHGCGISREHVTRIFERFYRVDKARSRKLGGTGLGLAIVKHIAQAHGGRAGVESTLGVGSTFTLHLPVSQVLLTEGVRELAAAQGA